jgi:hypothetical protein
MNKDVIRLKDEDCLQLGAILDMEGTQYRRLLRLAWRQNSYMQRQDVDRLEANAREWARYIPLADEARITRERYVGELAAKNGLSIPPATVEDLLDYTNPQTKQTVAGALGKVRHASAKLARQNELNRLLAEFCLDLVHEEAEIFKSTVLKDPTGCYDEEAHNLGRGPGGVIVRQA